MKGILICITTLLLNTSFNVTSLQNPLIAWNDVRMAYMHCIEPEWVSLSWNEEKQISDFICNYEFEEIMEVEEIYDDADEMTAGGTYILVQFDEAEVTHTWSFFEDEVSHEIYEKEELVECYNYKGSQDLYIFLLEYVYEFK